MLLNFNVARLAANAWENKPYRPTGTKRYWPAHPHVLAGDVVGDVKRQQTDNRQRTDVNDQNNTGPLLRRRASNNGPTGYVGICHVYWQKIKGQNASPFMSLYIRYHYSRPCLHGFNWNGKSLCSKVVKLLTFSLSSIVPKRSVDGVVSSFSIIRQEQQPPHFLRQTNLPCLHFAAQNCRAVWHVLSADFSRTTKVVREYRPIKSVVWHRL